MPVVLAVVGFYVTGLLLAYQMLRTLWLAVGLLIVGGLLYRWRRTSRPEPSDEGEEVGGVGHAADVQVRQLFRFVVVLVAAFGLFSIWSEAVPMLEALKRVQVFPRIMVMDAGRDLGSPQVKSPAEVIPAEETQEAEQTAAGESADIGPGLPAEAKAVVNESTPLTLWALLEALIAAIIALVLATNIPGLFELMMRRRTGLDSGARIAFSTLVRYAITIIGAVVVFGLLGITWSNVQWLAAALTFGLGFGLQEIVANFVSGLILLAERPIRVGDVVTVGSLMGKVTRIQIRATTITLWDRSEMIVPNKEFITTKLVNWTLSDSKRRIEIPVRVTYGTDLELVKQTMVEVAREHPNVLDDPAPHVLLLNFGDDAVQLELRFVVEFGKGLATKDQVQMAIDRAFRENGIRFALPQLTVSLPEGKISE
ncbi:MAG: mechanosensitive ion channel domain-containing protein [Acidobacteriota bacterium]